MRGTARFYVIVALSCTCLSAEGFAQNARSGGVRLHPPETLKYRISLKSSPNQPRRGNLRLSNYVTIGDVNSEQYYAYSGEWEYYLFERFTITGLITIPFNRAQKARFNYMGLGFWWHYLRFGDLSLISGVSGGGSLVTHLDYASEVSATAILRSGFILQGGNFLNGIYYHFIGTINYHLLKYNNIDFSHPSISLGWGTTI